MVVAPLHRDIISYLKKRGLLNKFNKQTSLFQRNSKHPSLNVELLEPKEFKIYSFRVDKKYRAIFNYIAPQIVEIIDVNNHYK